MMLIEWKGCGAVELIGSEKQRRGVVMSGASRTILGAEVGRRHV